MVLHGKSQFIFAKKNMKRTISLLLLGLLIFFLGVLSFHHHADGRTHEDCPLCRLGFQFSSFLLATLLQIYLSPSSFFLEPSHYLFPHPLILTNSLQPRAPQLLKLPSLPIWVISRSNDLAKNLFSSQEVGDIQSSV